MIRRLFLRTVARCGLAPIAATAAVPAPLFDDAERQLRIALSHRLLSAVAVHHRFPAMAEDQMPTTEFLAELCRLVEADRSPPRTLPGGRCGGLGCGSRGYCVDCDPV